MRRARQAMAIDLISMPKAWLHDSVGAINLLQQSMYVRHQVFIDLRQVRSEHGGQQDSANSRGRFDGQDQMAEGNSPRRRMRSRVVDLYLGQHIAGLLRAARMRSRVGHRRDASDAGMSAIKLIEQIVNRVGVVN